MGLKLERKLTKYAAKIVRDMPQLERDRLGFASKSAPRLVILERYVNGYTPAQTDFLVRQAARSEEEEYGTLRERRYATAARALQAAGLNRSKVSRILGISTSKLDRIVTAHREDVELTNDDPIVTALAPEWF